MADNAHAEDALRFRVENEFGQTVGAIQGQRPARPFLQVTSMGFMSVRRSD
jgi:hypothetical protein